MKNSKVKKEVDQIVYSPQLWFLRSWHRAANKR